MHWRDEGLERTAEYYEQISTIGTDVANYRH